MPFLMIPTVLLTAELMVFDALFTTMSGKLPPMAMVPPDNVMAPDALPKFRLFASTVPETEIVPVDSAPVSVPKWTAPLVVEE